MQLPSPSPTTCKSADFMEYPPYWADAARRWGAHVRYPAAVKALFLLALTIFILWIRRPDQFASPYIFIEDGYILRDFAERGVLALFGTVHGLTVLSARVISITAFKLSILDAPAIGVALAVAFTFFVVASIAFSPTHLRARLVSAVVPLIIPTGPETFAVPLMTIWWAGLLILLALLWRGNQAQWVRVTFIVIGGLSSPAVFPLAPLFLIRALMERQARDWLAAWVAVTCAAISLFVLMLYGPKNAVTLVELASLPISIGKFLGWFTTSSFLDDRQPLILWGLVSLGGLLAIIYAGRNEVDLYFILLVTALLAICIATTMRVTMEAPHAYYAAPRYFFYQFIILGWLLIWIIVVSEHWLRLISGFVLIVALLQGFTNPFFTWRHEKWNWEERINECATLESGNYLLPIHYQGGKANPHGSHITWSILLTKQQCHRMIARSLIRTSNR